MNKSDGYAWEIWGPISAKIRIMKLLGKEYDPKPAIESEINSFPTREELRSSIETFIKNGDLPGYIDEGYVNLRKLASEIPNSKLRDVAGCNSCDKMDLCLRIPQNMLGNTYIRNSIIFSGICPDKSVKKD